LWSCSRTAHASTSLVSTSASRIRRGVTAPIVAQRSEPRVAAQSVEFLTAPADPRGAPCSLGSFATWAP
jgi:hypothetical protein